MTETYQILVADDDFHIVNIIETVSLLSAGSVLSAFFGLCCLSAYGLELSRQREDAVHTTVPMNGSR
ncbi:MAG: hypothetical protein HFI63_07420 [Lachnospiraceae bacterium]|nr:hypothetical protein [Lachnospiraceae bacterium]